MNDFFLEIEEELKLLELQEDFRDGIINEEDILEEDKNKLIALYKKQNQQMKEVLRREKIEIQSLMKKLNST